VEGNGERKNKRSTKHGRKKALGLNFECSRVKSMLGKPEICSKVKEERQSE